LNQGPQPLERASELVHHALVLDDSLPEAHRLLGFVYLWQKQPEQAIAAGEHALALDPNNAVTYASLADFLTLAGRPAEALGLIQQAIRLNPRVPSWYTWELGMAYNQTGQYAKAIAAFKDTLRRNPNFVFAYAWLAVSYGQQWEGQWSHDLQTLDHQLEAAQRAVALSESVFWLHGVLGGGYLLQKRYAEALTAAERAVALAPNEPLSQAYLGQVLNFVGRPAETLERMEPVNCSTSQNLSPAFCFLVQGDAYALTGRHAEATTAYHHVLRHHPSGSGSTRLRAHFGLAASYRELGQAAEARAEVAEVLKTNPQFSLAVWQQRVPFQDPAVTERIASALRKAGLK
jgi:tetratricopeptide (TPR) repeat protein